ncbi:hypothetical protein Dimus_036411, partial [Dionaea muscipula]
RRWQEHEEEEQEEEDDATKPNQVSFHQRNHLNQHSRILNQGHKEESRVTNFDCFHPVEIRSTLVALTLEHLPLRRSSPLSKSKKDDALLAAIFSPRYSPPIRARMLPPSPTFLCLEPTDPAGLFLRLLPVDTAKEEI